MSSNKPNYNDGKTTMNTRSYSWDLVIYEIETEYLQSKLDYLTSLDVVRHYSYILHDKDVEVIEDIEQQKPLHTHLLITFSEKVSLRQIKLRLLEYTEHNMFGQPLKDRRGAYRYLTHKDNTEKYQYNDTDIVNYDDFFSKEDLKTDLSYSREYQEINNMIDDYQTLTYRQLACKYGKDFIKNFKAYQYYFELIKAQESIK